LVVGDTFRLADRIVVAPTNKQAWKLNDEALSMIPEQEKVYYSIDSAQVDENDINMYTPEFLNSQECPGMPFHKLVLKRGAVIMLLRNLQIQSGLLNGTRLLVLDLMPHVIQAQILKGSKAGSIVFIPRIDCIGSDVRMPFQLKRRQFPVSLSFAMTINKVNYEMILETREKRLLICFSLAGTRSEFRTSWCLLTSNCIQPWPIVCRAKPL
jgi:ATP-dependent DNA helicase PIF1